MSILQRARRVGSERRSLVVEAVFWTALARIAVFVLPFRWIAPRLGTPMAETAPTLTDEQTEQVRLVAWALEVTHRELPRLGGCLPQAIAAKIMLRRRGVPSTLYLGVRRKDDLEAHAWLRCGNVVLTGGPQRQGFTVVMALGDAPAEAPPAGDSHAA